MGCISFVAFGTRGDVQPLATLAQHVLLSAGASRVVLLTHVSHEEWLSSGSWPSLHLSLVDTSPARGWPDAATVSTATDDGTADVSTAVRQRRQTLELLQASRPSLIVFNLFALEAYSIAEALGVPCAAASPYLIPYRCPACFGRRFEKAFPQLMSALHEAADTPERAQAVTYGQIQHWMWPLFTETWSSWRRDELHLAPTPLHDARTLMPLQPLPRAVPLLYGFSGHVVPRPSYWPVSVHICGFWSPPHAWLRGAGLPDFVATFLATTADVAPPSSPPEGVVPTLAVPSAHCADDAAVAGSVSNAALPSCVTSVPLSSLGRAIDQGSLTSAASARAHSPNTSAAAAAAAHTVTTVSAAAVAAAAATAVAAAAARPIAAASAAAAAAAAATEEALCAIATATEVMEAGCSPRSRVVCVDFGSSGQLGFIPDPDYTLQVVTRCLKILDWRAVLLSTWPPLHDSLLALSPADLRERVLLVPQPVPHALLLPHCAAVLHVGGSGTIAAALGCGTPQVISPLHFDQPYWAERLAYLELCPPALDRDVLFRFTPDLTHSRYDRLWQDPRDVAAAELAEALRSATTPAMQEAVSHMAQELAQEDGLKFAAALLAAI